MSNSQSSGEKVSTLQTQSSKHHNVSSGTLSKRTIFSEIQDCIWRAYMWVNGSLVCSMLENWETILLFTVILTLSGLLWYSIIFHLPNHVRVSVAKASYYIFGTSSSVSSSGDLTKSTADLAKEAVHSIGGLKNEL